MKKPERKAMKKEQRGRCFYCGTKLIDDSHLVNVSVI